jgi:hypothetical protein
MMLPGDGGHGTFVGPSIEHNGVDHDGDGERVRALAVVGPRDGPDMCPEAARILLRILLTARSNDP